MKTTRLRVTMAEVEPQVVRVVDVPAAVLLPELHALFQVAIGWTDSHLRQFVADGARYGVPDIDGFTDELDETGVALRALPTRFTYLYDFGDGWEHDIEVIGVGGDEPGVVAGEGACPPEDVGGPHGYSDFRKAIGNRSHPEHDLMRTWAGAWTDTFDQATADLLVRQTVGAVPAPVRFLLELCADGVKLTPGGRLPRAFVRTAQERFPSWAWDEKPVSFEEDLPPLSALHDLLRAVGLLRLRKGIVSPTNDAGNDLEALRRLRSWFGPDDGFTAILTDELIATVVRSGPIHPDELAGRLLELLGSRWRTSAGEPLDEKMIRRDLYGLESVLIGLDLIREEKGAWTAGPSALWLRPRATGMAHLWQQYGADT